MCDGRIEGKLLVTVDWSVKAKATRLVLPYCVQAHVRWRCRWRVGRRVLQRAGTDRGKFDGADA